MSLALILRNRSRCAGIVLLAGAVSAFAQLVPDAPVQDFALPMFDEETGYKTWELRGGEGRYISQEEIEVIDMEVRVFNADEGATEQALLKSPRARIYLQQERAEGDSSIYATTEAYTLSGRGWQWLGEEDEIRVFSNVRVTFLQDLDNLIE